MHVCCNLMRYFVVCLHQQKIQPKIYYSFFLPKISVQILWFLNEEEKKLLKKEKILSDPFTRSVFSFYILSSRNLFQGFFIDFHPNLCIHMNLFIIIHNVCVCVVKAFFTIHSSETFINQWNDRNVCMRTSPLCLTNHWFMKCNDSRETHHEEPNTKSKSS